MLSKCNYFPSCSGGEINTLFGSKGSDDEGEAALLRIDKVLLSRPGAPRVDTAESHLTLLNVNLGERPLDKVAGVTSNLLVLHGTVVEI